MDSSPIHVTKWRLSAVFRQMNISYAIAGDMAANAHGHRRTTADVEMLMRLADLQRLKDQWLGHGWTEKFAGSKGFRDTHNNVQVDVLITGEFPGDGQEKPVSFPAPEVAVEVQQDGLPYVSPATFD